MNCVQRFENNPRGDKMLGDKFQSWDNFPCFFSKQNREFPFFLNVSPTFYRITMFYSKNHPKFLKTISNHKKIK